MVVSPNKISHIMELAKSFEPADIEQFWRTEWEARGYYTATLDAGKPSFSIQLPPPNVTGTLHMGHAFNQTIMDGLTRYHRMLGHNTAWIPGTDHAGIATQIVVERQLDAQKSRATTWAAKSSSKKSGSGKRNPAPPSPVRCAVWAPRQTGSANTSPWTSRARKW